MKLKQHLLGQNFKILISTVLVTVCLSLIFGKICFYRQTQKQSAACQTALMVGNEIIFSGPDITEFETRSVLLDVSAGKTETELEPHGRFTVSREQYAGENGVLYTLLKLTPVMQFDLVYRNLLCFVIFVFFITFFAAVMMAQKKDDADVIRPLLRLKEAADRLAAGDISVPVAKIGIGEVGELAGAMENLRLTLCNSVLRNKKYEDDRTFLLSSISHDLKTPVTAVRGYIEGVLDGVADTPEKQKIYLTKAIEKIKMLTIMIDDLLLYSRLDTGQVPFSFVRVSALGFMQQQIEEFKPIFAEKKRRLSFVSSLTSAAVLRLDPERFQRVVQNILNNALKHTEAEMGAVTVSLRETTASVIMEFRDNGKGIAPGDLPHIFERFYRADSARTTGGGSGLGLAIAHQLVTGMGGRIWAVSPPGEGCSILISMKKQN